MKNNHQRAEQPAVVPTPAQLLGQAQGQEGGDGRCGKIRNGLTLAELRSFWK